MRIAALFPLILLAACSSDKPVDDTLVTLNGPDGAAPVAAPGVAPADPSSGAGMQAVTVEGSKLEPLLSSAISAAGLDSGACRFSPAEGALPVLVASTTGGKAFVSLAGRQIDVVPSTAVTPTGASLAGQGISLAITANNISGSGSRAGSAASMQVNDSDGPPFTYQEGFWSCI